MREQAETRTAVPPSVRFPGGWAAAGGLGAGDEVITSHDSPAEVIARSVPILDVSAVATNPRLRTAVWRAMRAFGYTDEQITGLSEHAKGRTPNAYGSIKKTIVASGLLDPVPALDASAVTPSQGGTEDKPLTNADVLSEIRKVASGHAFMSNCAGDIIALLNLVRIPGSPTAWDEGLLTLDEWIVLDHRGKTDRLSDAPDVCDTFDTADFAYFERYRDRNDFAVRLPAEDTSHAWVMGSSDGTLRRLHAWDLWRMGYTPIWTSKTEAEYTQVPTVSQNDPPARDPQPAQAPVVAHSQEAIESQLVFLDRAHKMTSSDHLSKETTYSKSAGMIRQLLASSEPTRQPTAHMVGNNSDDKENS